MTLPYAPAAPVPPATTTGHAGRDRFPVSVSPVVAVLALAGCTVLARLPLVGLPPTPDEGGLLLLAGQWDPGRSLYGDYWVDRPPLLVDVFALAAHLGGPGDGGVLALRLLGSALVAVSVLLAGLVGRLARPPAGRPVAAAAVAAVLLCQPHLGVFEVDGELIAVPLVLAGLAGLLAAVRSETARGAGWLLVTTGACAAGAALVKQNEVDVVIVVVAAMPRLLPLAPLSRRRATTALVAGALGVLVVVLGAAVRRGTSLPGLWEAVVEFRWQASRVIADDATAATTDRLHQLLLAGLLAGLPLLLGRWVLSVTRSPDAGQLDLKLPTAAVLVWETISVLGGGSYWHHYLICLVPGLVLAEAQARRGDRRGAQVALGVVVALCAWPLGATYLAAADGTPADPTVTWLRAHVRPGDTGLVAYGRADILYGAGLSSPYPELWSLPVRVRDPQLHRLTRILESPQRPTWIVTGSGGTLTSWGLDGLVAQEDFRLGYDEVADLGRTRVYHVRDGT